jgi:hypothetical protein
MQLCALRDGFARSLVLPRRRSAFPADQML